LPAWSLDHRLSIQKLWKFKVAVITRVSPLVAKLANIDNFEFPKLLNGKFAGI